MHKCFLKTAALLGALSVALGAFAAHALKAVATEYAMGIFETAVRYQFYHVFALIITGILYKEFPGKALQWAGRLFIVGIILFSGSLYLLTAIKTYEISGLNWVGAITPFGGLCFISGWIAMFVAIAQKDKQ